jgi:DNA-binding response OmpR family regulator
MREPRPPSPQPSDPPAGSIHRAPGQRTRILVVEDDGLLAATICDVLVIGGYDAECAASVSEVQKLLERERFDLILADLGIPGAPKEERVYFADLRARAPGAAIIAMTGADTLLTAGPERDFDELIAKPFEIEDLMTCIHAVLDRRTKPDA